MTEKSNDSSEDNNWWSRPVTEAQLLRAALAPLEPDDEPTELSDDEVAEMKKNVMARIREQGNC